MMTRRELLLSSLSWQPGPAKPGFRLVDVTGKAGIAFTHNNGAFGRKYLPETLGPGCAFIDYDNDGWQDILLVNSMDWPGQKSRRSTLKLYRNNRDGTFTDVTRAAGLGVEHYGLGVAVGDFNNDGFPDFFLSCVGQSRLFLNNGRGGFTDVTQKAGLMGREGLSTSALWFDYDRDGRLDLLVANYVRWTPETDIFCSFDGKVKAYCTPEAYRGATCWLFRNRGGGVFEDVTAKAGLLDTSSKSLGVAMLDYDNDGWPDVFIANDTQPNKLYRNNRDGTFSESAVKAGLAFSEDGRARAGMGVDAADLENSGFASIVVTNFDNEMLGLYRGTQGGSYVDQAARSPLGQATRRSLGFGCFFFDADLDGALDLLVVNGHIDESITRARQDVTYAQPPHLFLNENGNFRDVASAVGPDFSSPKVSRGAAFGDFDLDGDLDVLVTTNNGPAHLYRNDLQTAAASVRVRLIGTRSNRDAIGAILQFEASGGLKGTRTVKSGSSYLSQSELPVTIGLSRRPALDRLAVRWPSGRTEEYGRIKAGARITIVEGKGIVP